MRRASRSRRSPDSLPAEGGEAAVPNSSGRPQTLARRACDACRARRRRCVFADGSEGLPHAQCHDCTRLGIPCSFLVPTRPRGPKRRKRAASLARESGDERPTEQSGSQKLDSEWNFATRVPLERRDEASRPLVPMIDHSSPYMPSHLSLDGTSPGLTVQQNASPGSSGPRFPTDELCSRALLNIIINDYLDLIYPLVPVVHRPSFRADLASDRDCKDPDFLCLVISLAALTVGLLPSRFPVYRAMAPEVAMRFETRTAMINCCSDICMRLRDHKYWDHISLRKWAVCYALSISFFQTGQTNRSRMLEVESTQVGRLLGLHRISDYNGLNCIETQLRKKAFWLLFYTFAHSALECGRRERLAFLDHYMLREVNFEALMPLPIDDEQILKHSIIGSTSPAASPSGSNSVPHRPPLSFNLSSAFIIHSQVFLQGVKEAISPDNCDCARRQTPEGRLSRLREHLQEIRYMLDDVPEPLRQWASTESYDSGDSPAPDLSGLRDRSSISLSGQDEANAKALLGQIGIMRADLHGTHLWLQSMLLDQIDVLIQKTAANEDAITAALKANWAEREDVCRQMLHLLHSMPYAHLEPNGLYLTYKVRDVAVALLNCPFAPEERPARRAAEYMRDFTRALSRLDRSEIVNTNSLKSWVDVDRERAPS